MASPPTSASSGCTVPTPSDERMLKQLIGAVFGTRHQREQRRVQPIVDEINEHYARLRDVTDIELQAQTPRFRAIIEERSAALKAEIEALKAAKHAAAEIGRASCRERG